MTTKERRYAQLQAAADARWLVYRAAVQGTTLPRPRTRTLQWAVECLLAAEAIAQGGRIGRLTYYRALKELSEEEVRSMVAQRDSSLRTRPQEAHTFQEPPAPAPDAEGAPVFPPIPEKLTTSSAVDYLDRVTRSLLRHCRRLEAQLPDEKPWAGGDLLEVTDRPARYLTGEDLPKFKAFHWRTPEEKEKRRAKRAYNKNADCSRWKEPQ